METNRHLKLNMPKTKNALQPDPSHNLLSYRNSHYKLLVFRTDTTKASLIHPIHWQSLRAFIAITMAYIISLPRWLKWPPNWSLCFPPCLSGFFQHSGQREHVKMKVRWCYFFALKLFIILPSQSQNQSPHNGLGGLPLYAPLTSYSRFLPVAPPATFCSSHMASLAVP